MRQSILQDLGTVTTIDRESAKATEIGETIIQNDNVEEENCNRRINMGRNDLLHNLSTMTSKQPDLQDKITTGRPPSRTSSKDKLQTRGRPSSRVSNKDKLPTKAPATKLKSK